MKRIIAAAIYYPVLAFAALVAVALFPALWALEMVRDGDTEGLWRDWWRYCTFQDRKGAE